MKADDTLFVHNLVNAFEQILKNKNQRNGKNVITTDKNMEL